MKIIDFSPPKKPKNKYVQSALKHVKKFRHKIHPLYPHPRHPTRMLTTHSHLREGVKKYPDEFPISYRIRFMPIKNFLKKMLGKIHCGVGGTPLQKILRK